jgi:tetratricopeptide (TPR) repeat protein
VARRLLAAGLLVAATVAVYAPVGGYGFLNYDDRLYVVENPLLRAGWSGAAQAFRAPHHDNWIPLTWLSLALDYQLFGLEPAGYHWMNVGLHALGAAALLLALARLTGALGRSAFIAAVFALHPLHVESVAWISERKDVLSGLFFSLALLAHAHRAERPDSRARSALVLACGALGLMAKPMLVTLPGVLLLLDFWPLGRLRRADQRRRALREKFLLWVLSAGAAAAALAAQRAAGATLGVEQLPFALRVQNAAESALAYLGASLWPTGLAAYYPHPGAALSPLWALACALVLLGITLACWRAARRQPWWLVGWLWYLGMLLPVLGLVQVGLQARADRYTYLPQIGLALALAWGACQLVGPSLRAQRALAGLALACLFALALASRAQLATWRDTRSLFEHALEVTQGNYYAHSALGAVELEAGRLAAAEAHYREAIRLAPGWAPPRLGLAYARVRRGDRAGALRLYREGLALDPAHAGGHAQLAALLLAEGQPEPARAEFERALALGADSADVRGGLGTALARLGRAEEALAQLREAQRRDPELRAAALELAWLLATCEDERLRDPAQAVAISEAQLRRGQGGARLYQVLAASYAAAGRVEEARAASARAESIARRGASGP